MIKNKRFVNIGDEIHLNGEWWCGAGGEHCADVIATALNELLEENEKLYELICFANTLFVFKTSESCQMEWEKRLNELKSE